MANGSNGTWHGHGKCPYNTARYEHISMGHESQYDTHVGRVELRILDTQTLKARHN